MYYNVTPEVWESVFRTTMQYLSVREKGYQVLSQIMTGDPSYFSTLAVIGSAEYHKGKLPSLTALRLSHHQAYHSDPQYRVDFGEFDKVFDDLLQEHDLFTILQNANHVYAHMDIAFYVPAPVEECKPKRTIIAKYFLDTGHKAEPWSVQYSYIGDHRNTIRYGFSNHEDATIARLLV